MADRVIALDLRDPAGAALPSWTPGAHIDVILGSGRQRQFSLCGDPADATTWRIAVLRETTGRGGSQEVHDALTEGSPVRVRGPRNHFRLEPAGRYLFIAGGIGITPILPMLAAAQSAADHGPWTMAGAPEPRWRSAKNSPRGTGRGCGSTRRTRPGCSTCPPSWASPADCTLVYCCGPSPLLDAVQQHCAGWPAGTLHTERFTPQPGTAPGEAFEVELAQSGLILAVPPDRSILQTVQDAGLPVLFSCTEGTCGTCETAVLDGIPEHRDSVLSDEERVAADTMMICVSRSATAKLVLDL